MEKGSLIDYNAQRGVIKGKLTRFQNYLNPILNQSNPSNAVISQLEIRLGSVEPLLATYESIQYQIEVLQSQDEEITANNAEREAFEDQYYSLLAMAKTIINKANSNTPASSSSTSISQSSNLNPPSDQLSQIRLPTISLPIFAGNFENWLEFRDTFNSLIHSNANITPIQKFHYLKASLKGEAAQIIQSLQLCDANYAIAWDALLERYDNKRLIVHNHIKALFNLPCLSKESPTLLRQLLDGVSKHLRSLKALNQPVDQWDTLLIHILVNKLDPISKREWETYKFEGEFPSIHDLKAFLKSKSELLETLNFTQTNETKTHIKPKFDKQSNFFGKPSNSHYSSNTFLSTNETVLNKPMVCAFCKQEHAIYQCEVFQELPVASRIAEVKNRRLCFNCLRESHSQMVCRGKSRCKECKRKHHTLLHLHTQPLASSSNVDSIVDDANSQVTPPSRASLDAGSLLSTVSNHVLANVPQQILLSTAMIKVQGICGTFYNCRALLDSGSQSNFITEELCNLLGLEKHRINLAVTGIHQLVTKLSHKADVVFQSNCDAFKSKASCIVIPKITGNIPNVSFNPLPLEIPPNIKLADSSFHVSNKIDILLGAEIFWGLICIGQIKLGNGQLILQKTRFGWVLAGPLSYPSNISNQIVQCNFSTTGADLDLQNQLARFWELEECQNNKAQSREEIDCENHFVRTTTRKPDGRFCVFIPLKGPVTQLGESRDLALKQFYALERKFSKNLSLKQRYVSFINEYKDMGHMTKLENFDDREIAYYLPHHGVIKEDSLSTKLRVVFNGSAKTSSGLSLNDIQMIGPVIQDDLFSILVRFRKHKYVLSSDVAKMYRQVLVHPAQRNLQRIVWRENSDSPVDDYVLNTVTYGQAASSFLAIRSLQQLGYENAERYPRSAEIILRDFYVDDLLTGADSIEDAVKIRNEISSILRQGCFELRKWISNEPQILEGLAELGDSSILPLGDSQNTKTLGLIWLPISDSVSYNISMGLSSTTVTKRSILTDTAKIFDPLGLLAPSIIIPKIILQQLWQSKLSWDESIPSDLHTRWLRFKNELKALSSIKIPRCILLSNPVSIELHGYSDASEAAYGACLYVRSIDATGQILVKLLSAKAKVAPLKTLSIPRLELCGALLLSRLVSKINAAIQLNFTSIFCWSDSTVVLAWIRTSPSILKTFVANRVSEIQELVNEANWRHVRSEDNPADLISRGVSPNQLATSNLWWYGPGWLSLNAGEWPSELLSSAPEQSRYLVEMRQHTIVLNSSTEPTNLFERFSSLSRLKRCVAYCIRFKTNALRPKPSRVFGALSADELKYATLIVLREAQRQAFLNELTELKRSATVNAKSKLLSLNPFIDKDGLIRVGGRLRNSNFSTNKKHPIVLPNQNKLTVLIIQHQHELMLHAGPQTLLAAIRETYWPISARNLIRRVVHNCVVCFRAKPKVEFQLMGSLPKDRISPSPPFDVSGVDYCGPILIKDRKGRGCKTVKAYICLFICFAVKAVHLELVGDLTTESFLAALRRFSSRRGKPSKIYSDNGTNFVGSYAELKRFLNSNKSAIENSSSDLGISWQFIPPRSPHFGGLWEASVKNIKHHLKRVVGNALLTYEELYTILTQVEAVVNSRPLCPISNDPNDLSPLTPAHFLIGRDLMDVPQPELTGIKEGRLSRFQLVQQITQNLWKRWSREYLGELQTRSRWKTNQPTAITPGAMVLLKEDNTPPLKWHLGRVVETHPGSDGVIRVVSVKCGSGVHKRAITKVCVLPIN